MTLQRQPPLTPTRTFLDSFDWRLYGAGLLLFIDVIGGRRRLHLRSGETGLDIVAIDIAESPCFASDLPEGVMRRRIAPLLAPRRLLEQVTLKSRLERLHLTDDEGKTVARLSIEQHRVDPGDGARCRRLRERVVLMPVRGFADALEGLREIFEHDLAWERIKATELDEAMMALGRQPFEYNGKPSLEFEPGTPIGSVARALCTHLFNVIEVNEDGVRHDLDIEFLHDFRVAIRRTRVLLREMDSMLDAPHFQRFRDDFAWLGTMTTPVRDLDVHLFEFPQYAAWVGEQHAGDLAPLRSLLREQRGTERRNMLAAMASPRYRNMKNAWRRLLDNDEEGRWLDGEAGSAVVEAASQLVMHRQRKVLKHGERLDQDSADERFHDLRKQCKRLRYLIEFFVGQFPAAEVKPLIKALKRLQDNLGEYQDLCVHMQELSRFGELLEARGRYPEPTAKALSLVVAQMSRRKQAVRREFVGEFERFAAASKHNHFEPGTRQTARAVRA